MLRAPCLSAPFIVLLACLLPSAARTAEPLLEGSVWADESLLGSPVALSLDAQGRAYVVQTVRRRSVELDIRSHQAWIPDVLSFRSREDQRAFLEKELSPERSTVNRAWLKDLTKDGISDFRDLGVLSEKVLRIEDKAEKGVADTSVVWVDGLDTEMTGVAAGVMAHGDAVYMTSIPHLWKFGADRPPGRADAKGETLLDGFGVRIAYSGHDMHGLVMGPDGRVYWSIGDKGLHVRTPDGREVNNADSGAIVRCEPDGSGFEVFASGLRNPQEFAFDEWGDAFTADNDADFPGERERLIFAAEGSDSGWRSNFQYRKSAWNPWMDEKLSVPAWPGQAAHIVPALALVGDGPCGFVYAPGTALGARWERMFFMTQFPGRKLVGLRVERAGAGFKLAEQRVVYTGPMMTGLAWGPDGALYVADWNSSAWEPHEKGKVWKLDAPAAERNPARGETQRVLREGMEKRALVEVAGFLGHADQRVRLAAQFEMAKRKESAALLEVLKDATAKPLARIHAIWGLGQLGRREPAQLAPLLALLENMPRHWQAEDFAQAAKVIGDAKPAGAGKALETLMTMRAEPRVHYQVALAMGKVGVPSALPALFALAEFHAAQDPFLRHAAVMALAGAAKGQTGDLVQAVKGKPAIVRLCAVVALRRLGDASVATFLRDADALVAAEAARAIHDDASIPAALPVLAEALPLLSDATAVRRAISANLRTAGREQAQRLIEYALQTNAPAALRIEALEALASWTKPDVLDRVEGRHRPQPARPAQEVHAVLDAKAAALLDDPTVAASAASLIERTAYPRAGAMLAAVLEKSTHPLQARLAALQALATLGDARVISLSQAALRSQEVPLRSAALSILATRGAGDAGIVPLLAGVLKNGTDSEKQHAFAILAKAPGDAAHALLGDQLEALLAGKLAPALHLDVLEAVRAVGAPLAARLAVYEKSRPADALGPYREALHGGDGKRGKTVAIENLTVQCTRCHRIGGEGADVGPDLAKIGKRLTREQILESLVDPGAQIAKGYGLEILTLKNGQVLSGSVTREDSLRVMIRTTEGAETAVPKADIRERSAPVSTMPPMGALVTARELRDLVEYLASLK